MTEQRRDVLIDRITANEAGEVGFREFEILAAREPAAWERLARTLRDELQLRAALASELDGAATAEMALAARREYSGSSRERSSPRFGRWSGWGAAALLAVVWIIIAALPADRPGPPPTIGQTERSTGGGVIPVSLTADDALSRYLEAGHAEGRVIAELPAVMIDSRATEEGALEVFYLRQFLERERVQSVYEVVTDEDGNPVPVRINPTTWDRPSNTL